MHPSLKRAIPTCLLPPLRVVRHKYKTLRGFKFNGVSGFAKEAENFFLEQISQSKVYLEYGSGSSTLTAIKHAPTVVTVESDAEFLKQLRQNVQNGVSRFYPLYADIGLVHSGGEPVCQRPTPARIERWKKYSQTPWELFRKLSLSPDMILIDGRFRVACLLESLLNLEAPCLILFDDYAYRHQYHVIEPFIEKIEYLDDMLVLKKTNDFDRDACRELLAKYYADFR